MRVFVDTAWNSKKHTCYDPIKDAFFEVDSLVELKDYQEMYLDSSIFPNMWQQLREIINEGKRVYYFAKPWKWKEIRERFREDLKNKTGKVSKTDKGDAYLIYKVYELSLIKGNIHKYFKPLTIIDVELRPLLMRESMLYRSLRRVQGANMIGIDVGVDVKILERMVEDVRREIVDKAFKLIPGFIDVAKGLGLDMDYVDGLTGLAGLLVYNKFITSYKKSIKFLGLYKATGREGRKMKKYNRKAQRYLLILTNAILCKNGEHRLPKYKDLRKILKIVIELEKKLMGLAGEGLGWKP